MWPLARDPIRDRLGTRRKIGFADRLDREQQRGEVVARIRRSQRADHEIDIGSDVEVLGHDGDVARPGADELFGEPVPQRLLARSAQHQDSGEEIQTLHNGAPG